MMPVLNSTRDLSVPSELCPSRLSGASLSADEIVGITDIQSCGSNRSSVYNDSVADRIGRIRDSTVPLTQGE